MGFNEREKGFEQKFSMDQQSLFKIEARASKLIGLWAAEQLGLVGTEAENYAKDIISVNLDEPGYDDVKRRVESDFTAKGLSYDPTSIDLAITKSVSDATLQIESEMK